MGPVMIFALVLFVLWGLWHWIMYAAASDGLAWWLLQALIWGWFILMTVYGPA